MSATQAEGRERPWIPKTPMFWCEACGYAEIPPAPDGEGRPEGASCPQCYAECTHVTPMVPASYAEPAPQSEEVGAS